jgi:hypothetical protein
MAIVVKKQDGTVVDLDASALAIGINTSHNIGRQLEVTGVILSRTTEEPGVAATALVFSAEGPNIGHIAINENYRPEKPGKGFRRALTFGGGNVGIGNDFSAADPPSERLVVQGNILVTGDVRLAGADCAEEFGVDGDRLLEPGTVMVIGDDEGLRPSAEPYDSRVAGVCSGAGAYRPGLILGRQPSALARIPLALVGRVYCKVDARFGPIGVGDLLTTSTTAGHAMRAFDRRRAVGAILGKALRPWADGCGLIPILVTLL